MERLTTPEIAESKGQTKMVSFWPRIVLSGSDRYCNQPPAFPRLLRCAQDDLTTIERVYADWQALPQKKRDAVGADFLDVAGLATKQGVQVIIIRRGEIP